MLSDAHSLGYLWGNAAFFRAQGTRLLLKSSSRVRLHTRARATYDRAYLVWHAKEGSIAETSVNTLLKSVGFTIFKLTEYMLSTKVKFCHI